MSSSIKFIRPDAYEALQKAFESANLRPVITQTQGDAAQSSGFHAGDGEYTLNGAQHSYCAAVDLSVNQSARRLSDGATIRMDKPHIKWVLFNLAQNGYVGWYRYQPIWDSKHIHIIGAMVPMKRVLQDQVIDFLNNRTGLSGHGPESFWTADDYLDAQIAEIFKASNPDAIDRLPLRLR